MWHGGLRVKVTIALAKLIIYLSKSPADGSSLQTVIKVIAKDANNISYTVMYIVGGKKLSLGDT